MQEAENNMQTIDGRMWFQADEMLPVVDLFAVFETEMAENNARIIYIKDAKGSAALLTGPVTGRQTAVEKPLPPLLGHIYRKNTGIVGCTITETGTLGIMNRGSRLRLTLVKVPIRTVASLRRFISLRFS